MDRYLSSSSALLLLLLLALIALTTIADPLTIVVKVGDLFQKTTEGDDGEGHSSWSSCRDCHRFDGIGAISGGGGTSRLLVEYPSKVQKEILDFLFLPNYGASLHILKVEIGGDAQSTDGSETSHMHSRDDNNLNWHRGYQWYMLREAKKRNPNLLTYGLPWAWPGWLTTKQHGNPFEHMGLVTNYTLQWVKGLRDVHGIELDYLGIWNEIGTSREYLLAMRQVLDEHGFTNTKLVSNDGAPNHGFLPPLINDTQYLQAIDVLGFHYPSDDMAEIWKLANSYRKPIWAAEESSSYDDLNGAACWARVIASHYVLNNMTANIMWNLLGSYAHGTNWYASSMLTANQPWTGYYEWEQMSVVWATAHYTQFIQPGWQFLPVGRGCGELASGGYYLTLVSPDLQYFTLIVVKISRDHAPCTRPPLWDWDTQDETFHISIQSPVLHPSAHDKQQQIQTQTWYSNLEQDETRLFEKLDEDHQNNNNGLFKVISTRDKHGMPTFDITLNVTIGSIFTVTNQLAGDVGHKGKSTIHKKPNASFPLPYQDNFHYNYNCTNCYAHYAMDQMGAFEIQLIEDDNGDDTAQNQNQTSTKATKALQQMTPTLPITWWQVQRDRGPVSIIGMTEWEDIEVAITFRLPKPDQSASSSTAAGALAAAACISTRTDWIWERGVTLCANASSWFAQYGGANLTGFDSSSAAAIAYGSHDDNFLDTKRNWHSMSLATMGDQVQAKINGDVVVEQQQMRLGDSGFAAIGTSAYAPVLFGTVQILPIGKQWIVPLPAPTRRKSSTTSTALQQQQSTESGSWSLSFAPCTPNGLSKESEQFDLTSNWQILHLPSGLCVTVVVSAGENQEAIISLTMAKCQHDYAPQQFRHRYTLIRNGREYPLSNELGDLCATQDGKVSLLVVSQQENSTTTMSCGGGGGGAGGSVVGEDDNASSFFSKWALYPNTHQLRNAFGYRSWLDGSRAYCLRAIQEDQEIWVE